MIDSTTQQKIKSFWKRPEGVTGAIFIIGLVVLFAFFWTAISAFVISMLQSMLTAILLGVGIIVVLYVLIDPKFRNLVWYMYKSFMRWITGLFVQIDPIKILESYVDYLYKNLREMNTHIGKLKGQTSKLQRLIDKNKQEMSQNLKMAEQAKKKNNMELVAINTRQFGRLKESNDRYTKLLNKMELLYRVLSKIHRNSGYLIKDTENEVRMRKQEYKALKAGHSAMKSAMNIISGDPDKKQMFDMATEAIVDDVHNKIGEMERFIEISGSFIDSVDLQNGVYEQEGLELLEKMEADGMSFLLGDTPEVPGLEKEQEKEKPKDIGNVSDYNNLFS